MTQLPRLESRIGAQERITTLLHASIEELSQDMTASFKQQANYQIDFEHKVDAHFAKIDARFNKINEDLVTIKGDMVAMESRVEARIVALETRMLDAFKQLIVTIDARIPPSPQKE